MTTSRRTRRAPALLASLLAAFATAALAHGLIGLLGTLGVAGDADAYAEHAHGAVAPVALAAVAVLAGLLLRAALGAAARRDGGDPVVALARHLARADLRLPVCVVGGAGFATLVAMEFVEQLAAFGHADLAGALGGDPLLGAGAVALTALLVTVAGARCARALVAAAVVTSRALAALFVVAAGQRPSDPVAGRLVAVPARISAGVLLARRRPSRAPPVWH